MGFKEWWKKQKLWVKGLVIGVVAAIVIYILSFIFINDSEFVIFIWSFGAIPFCKIFNLSGEDCAFVYLFYGWLFLIIVYGLIGTLLGLFIEKIKK